MAISASCVWEVRTTGADTNGGGYVSGGTDYSQQNTPVLTLTDISASGSTLTSATGGFTSAMVGNIICLYGGSGSLARTRRQITSFVDSNTVVVDATVATGSNITGNVGGAIANPGECCAKGAVAYNTIWIKSGTYYVNDAGYTNGGQCCANIPSYALFMGYNSSRGDAPTGSGRPLIQATNSISSFTLVNGFGNVACFIAHVRADGNNYTSSRGYHVTDYACAYNCEALNCKNNGFAGYGIRTFLVLCSATGCTTNPAIIVQECFFCVAHNNSVTGFGANTNGISQWIGCVSAYNTGTNSHGFSPGSGMTLNFINCTAHQNGGSGIYVTDSTRPCAVINCVSTENGAYGFHGSGNPLAMFYHCVGWGNTSGDFISSIAASQKINCSSATSDPFVASNGASPSDSGYLAPNSTAGAGALLRSSAFPSAYPYLTGTTNYQDIGAIGHPDSGSGGGLLVNPGFNGGVIL